MALSPDTPLYNSRIFDAYLKLLQKRYPHLDITELLRHAQMKVTEIADQGHWFSQRQVDLFHEKLVQLTGDTDIAREAGRYAASPDALGPFRFFIMGLISPEYLFRIIEMIGRTFSRSSRCSSRLVGRRQLELTVTFEEGVRENPRQCQNRIGFIEAVFLVYGQPFPEIEHEECIFNGGNCCRYLIRWRPTIASRVVWARRASFSLLMLSSVVVAYLSSNPFIASALMTLLSLYLGLSLMVQKVERKSLISSLNNMRTSSEKLLSQVQEGYDSALMIKELGQVISNKVELDEIVSSVNEVLKERLNYGRGLLLLADRDRRSFDLKGSFGSNEETERTLRKLLLSLDISVAQGVLGRCFHSQKPLLVNRMSDVEKDAIPESFAFFSAIGVTAFICVPIVCEGESVGLLAVDDAKREGPLLQSDLNLIQGVAQVIGVAIRNSMRLIHERELAEKLRQEAENLIRVEERSAELCQEQEALEILYDSVSHDLRTPLRVIYGYSELLLDNYSDRLDEAGREYIGSMIKAGEKMEATLDRMLDFSEVRLIELSLQQVDLSELATSILVDLQVADPQRWVTVQVQESVVVTGDRKLLKSVLENLLSNAWKYTAGRPHALIRFGMINGICFVEDNGDGFDMAKADRLFKPFQRLHGTASFAGHGLGLALVQRIVDRLGGKVWGVGKPGEGAIFYFTVPEKAGTTAESPVYLAAVG
jgi:signal transduction histidine kinase